MSIGVQISLLVIIGIGFLASIPLSLITVRDAISLIKEVRSETKNDEEWYEE